MNFMQKAKYSLGASETSQDIAITVDKSNAGWMGTVQYVFPSDVSGDVSLRMKPMGETFWVVLAAATLSSQGNAIWTGNVVLRDGDILRLGSEVGTACDIYVTYVYEPWGEGSWQKFAV